MEQYLLPGIYQRQQCKIKWVAWVDDYTTIFFHSFKNNARFTCLKGIWCWWWVGDGTGTITGLQNNYFQELFTSKRTSSTSYRHRTIGEILAAQPPRLTPKDIVWLWARPIIELNGILGKQYWEFFWFSKLWISIIMECASPVTYSVLIKGLPSQPFRRGAGLRDARSPYLFILSWGSFEYVGQGI